jgi:hypothetical protein
MEGGCLCGGVRFRLDPPLREVIACHCSQCRKTSGHVWAATSVPMERFHLLAAGSLRWFQSSAKARRGFCATCGASLFWEPLGEGRISVAAGALDGPTGLTIESGWFLEDAGDYYHGTTETPEILTGSCLCGANHFTLPGPMGPVTACHCSQCRRLSGHFAASFDVDETALSWQARSITEFTTPGGGQRGFCPTCGSSLHFRDREGNFSVEAGVIDNPTGGRLTSHIFTADKGDYYALTDGPPQRPAP